jgi:hypothetical protein
MSVRDLVSPVGSKQACDRAKLLVAIDQIISHELGIAQCDLKRGVAEDPLEDEDVATSSEILSGERMSKKMRIDPDPGSHADSAK